MWYSPKNMIKSQCLTGNITSKERHQHIFASRSRNAHHSWPPYQPRHPKAVVRNPCDHRTRPTSAPCFLSACMFGRRDVATRAYAHRQNHCIRMRRTATHKETQVSSNMSGDREKDRGDAKHRKTRNTNYMQHNR